jgi:hypothetical protein
MSGEYKILIEKATEDLCKATGISFSICPRCISKKAQSDRQRVWKVPDDYRYCDYHQKEILREVKIK